MCMEKWVAVIRYAEAEGGKEVGMVGQERNLGSRSLLRRFRDAVEGVKVRETSEVQVGCPGRGGDRGKVQKARNLKGGE